MKINRHYTTGRGYTLIEIMIVIAIIGIVSGILFFSLSTEKPTREVEASTREFIGIVREAQNNALSGKQLIAGTDPCYYEVNWSGSSYTLRYQYKDAAGNCTQHSDAAYTLKGGVAFSSAASLQFKVPHAQLDFASGSRAVVLTKSSATRVACVYFNGRIIDEAGSTCP